MGLTWTRTLDNLPEIGVPVWAYDKSLNIHQFAVRLNDRVGTGWSWFKCDQNGNEGGAYGGYMTHWMPISLPLFAERLT